MSKLKAASPAVLKGGPGSGHHGHSGRPGKRGGSVPGAGGALLGVLPPAAGTAPELKYGWIERDVRNLESDKASEFLDTRLREGEQEAVKGDWWGVSDVSRSAAKTEIVRELSERTNLPEEDVNDFVKQWAHSANDEDMRSLSIQEAASEEFGLKLSNWQQERIDAKRDTLERSRRSYVTAYGVEEADKFLRASDAYRGYFSLMPRDQERSLLRSMYENTQDKLSKAGFAPDDTITLFRGIKEEKVYFNAGDTTFYKGNTVESWSASYVVARSFADTYTSSEEGLVLAMNVPVKNILGTARTGFGCLSEGEFVIMSGMDQEARVAYVSRVGR